MAVQRFRYQMQEPTVDENQLKSEIDSTLSIVDQSQGQFVDIDVEGTLIADADDAMALRGFVRTEGPGVTGTPGDAAEFVRKAGDTMTGDLNINNNRVTNVPDTPTAPTDAINANYVQNQIKARDPKDSCRLCDGGTDLVAGGWTASGSGVGKTLTSPDNLVGNNDFDSVTAVLGDRILVKTPTTGANAVHNGIYTVTQLATGSVPTILTRATDADEDSEVTQGLYTFVQEGTTCARFGFQVVTQDPITVDTTQINVQPVSASDIVTAGAGIARSVNTLSVELDTAADAQGVGNGGGSSGLEYDASGDNGKLRVRVNATGGIQRTATGIAVELDAAGALESSATGLKVRVDGTTIQINGSNQLEVLSAGSAQLHWGSGNVGSSTTDRFMFPNYGDGIAQTTTIQIRMSRAGTLKNLRVRHEIPAGNGNNIVYTVRKNGTPQSLAATLASTASDGADLVNTVTVAAADLIDIIVTKATSVAGSPRDITGTLEFTS